MQFMNPDDLEPTKREAPALLSAAAQKILQRLPKVGEMNTF